MSKMCLYPTPKIQELANKIKQEYPEASKRNNFSDQMCAEWVGLYNSINSKNPDDVPAMKSLVNFIEKLRNQEGKSFLRDLKAEEKQRAIEQEMQDIKAKAIANGTFMKAPNGKDTNLTERQWLQVRTRNFKNWFGDWEKYYIFANELNNKYNGKENAERLSLQRMDLAVSPEIERELKEAISVFERGKNSSGQGNEGSSRETNEQKQRRIEKWAKDNNLWVDNLSDVLVDNFGAPIEGGGEAVVYDAGDSVVKSISLDYYDGDPQLALDRILLHNHLFKDTQLTDIGFGRDSDGTFKILVSQPYIKGTIATREEILQYAKNRGFRTTDGNTFYINGIKINDLNELNVIKSSDGTFRVIDAELRFIPQNEIDSVISNTSKVLDKNGEPLVVYHGSDEKFTTFDVNSKNRGSLTPVIKKGFYFSNKNIASQYASSKLRNDYFKLQELQEGGFSFEEIAEAFGANRYDDESMDRVAEYIMSLENETIDFQDNLYAVFLNIKQPVEYDLKGKIISSLSNSQKETINNSEGAIIKNVDETTSRYRGEITTPGMYVGTDYIVFEPNQVKSATDNNGEFSTENDVIFASPQAYEEIPVELMGETADEAALREAFDTRESSDPDLNKKFGGKIEVTVSEILNNLLQNNSPFEGFIKSLLDNIGEIGNIKVKLVPNSQSRGLAGFYDAIENTIYINRNDSYKGKDGKVDNTIVHEIVHAIVANSLNTPKYREELGKIFEDAREKILKKYGVNSFEELPENLKNGKLYGLQNLDEFAAEFFTNSEFISELNDENTFGKRSDKKSIISRLVEWIKSLLPKGVTETYKRSGEILEDILLNSGGTIQTLEERRMLGKDVIAANTQDISVSTIDPRFKQGIETLAGYYEGGGRLITDDYPGVPKELDDKLNNHFMGGKELSDDDYRELAKYISIAKNTDANTSQGWPYIAVPKQQTQASKPTAFTESKGWYPVRTRENITWSDVTLAFVVDENSSGEKLTERVATEQGKYIDEYLPNGLNISDIKRLVRNQIIGMQNDQSYGHKGKVLPIKNIKLNIAGNGIYTLVPKGITQEQMNDYVTAYLKEMLAQGVTISEIRSGGQTGVDEAGIIAAQRLGIPASVHAPNGWVFRDANNIEHYGRAEFISRFGQSTSSQDSEAASLAAGATTFGTAPTAEQQAEAQRKYEEANTPKPKPVRPQSDAFDSALKVTENRITQFYQTFTPQQIKDRGTMIADYFSDIIDDYILDELDRLNDIIEDDNKTAKEKEEARKLRNLLRDPINGRQYAVGKIQISNILNQIKDKIRRNVNSHDGVEKQLWQNTLNFFDELFNNQASLEIEEQEGIRIVGLQMIEKSPDDLANDEASDGDDETGHTVSGNDGWIFQVRFEDPAASLSKKVRRMLYNVKRSSEDKDDLGHTRKYSSGQIYATLLSYLAKTMEDPDAFMQVTKLEDYGDDLYDHYGNQVTEELYPYGYPTFPVLEKMRDQYPWVEQIINRLTDDYLDAEWNTCIAYPSTYGAMASQFYTNFRKVFIPYAKIQVGEGKFGITPLNTEMEARCQQDKLSANYNNGIVLTDTGIYNTDKTINREHAADLMDFIKEVIDNDGVEHAYRLYKDISDENTEVDQEDIEEFDLFINRAVFILNSFGISSNRENVIALLAQEEQGQVFLDMMKDLHYIADTISKVSDENAKDYNYLVDPQYVGGRPLWKDFFNNRGLITDESYMQSFYDSATKKTRYSYSADNYIQKTFRGLYNPDINKRRKFIEDNYMKYEWFYNHKTNTWRNKWLEHLYNAQDITDEIPYRNINNITDYDEGKVRDYTKWTPDDIWLVQNRSYRGDSAYSYYLAPIFSDSPMSMTVKGPVLSSAEVLDALVGLVDQEMWRIKYVNDRAKAIERGDVKEIANFDGKRGKEFCFIPELNTFTFENGETLLQVLNRMKEGKDENGNRRVYTAQEIDNVKRNAIMQIMAQKATEYLNENSEHYSGEIDSEAFLRSYMNMVYANASIIQFTTIDLAFYKSYDDFQKRFKEVYAGGIQLNTNSRFGKKTENTFLIADDIITSPSYTTIAGIVNGSKKLTEKDKEHILGIFTDINVADAQAIRAMHSFRSVMDMMGRWDERAQEALEHFEKGEWNREDFDVIYQIIKPFVYAVIDRNDGFGGVIPVPQQHKNSEICALMMYNLITNDLKSPVYEALSEFMDLKDANGEYLTDMAQFESGGKVGNQGVVNISFNPENVIKAISKQWDENNKKDGEIKDLLDKYDLDTAEKDGKFLPNDVDNAEANYKAIKKQLDKALKAEKISQEDYKKIINYLRPTKDDIISILKQKVLVTNEDGSLSINPEVVHTIPFDNYYQAQPTPEHHLDAEATFGSQARNIGVADLPEDFELTLTVKGGKTITLKGRDAVIDFYYELLDENLIEDFYGDGKKKKGLKGVFESKESLRAAVEEIVRGNPKYGKDFIDALKTDSDGNFTLPPNSPTMFTLMQELVTSLFKNRITKQKINGAALIQAAGIGLDDKLRLVRDENGNIAGAQCLMPLTSKKFFEPFLVEREINGKKVMMLDPDKLEAAGLNRALGYRIPTENKSSMLPLIITGFTPLQNGSCIILPAEITALAGSDFDVDKMYVMLSEFYIQNYNMKEAREAWADENYLTTSVFSNPDLEDEISDEDPEEFRKWFNKNKSKYELDKPVVKRVEYDFSKSPKENGRKARNNMLIQILYNILTSRAGNESLLNPQGFDNFKGAAKLNRIINDPTLREQLMKNYAAGVSDAVPSAKHIRSMFLDNYKDMDADTLNDLKKSLMSMTDEQVIQAYIEATVAGKEGDGSVIDFLLDSSLEDREEFIKKYSAPESPIYPQTFAHSHARNMAGTNQLGIYALQGSMAAKYQRAHITLRESQQFKVNGRTIKDVDVSENGKRLKRVGEMIGASADNGKDPNLSDAGSTEKTAPIIGYMLRLGLTHEEAVLIINQPTMKAYNYKIKKMEKQYPRVKSLPVGDVSTKTLIKAILSPMSVTPMQQQAIDAMCYRILKQAKAMEGLTMISRADSTKGAMQNTFAKARVQQYMVEKFNAQMGQNDFPFNNIKEVINNTAIDVSKGENDVREKLKAQPMAFLHAMYALGINSLSDLASPYFFMLSEHFDDAIVKPILYNQNSDYKETLEDIVNKIYLQYITYVLSSSPLFGDETNADGTVTTMKEKRDYYLNSFADDFAKTLQEHKEIHNLLGSILQRDGNRVVLRDVGSLAKGQKDVISRRFDALFTLGEENSELREVAQKLAKDLLLYSYYDSGLNFTHDSFSSRLSTYFLSQFPAFRDVLLQLDNPLTEEQEQRFIYQFLLNNKEAAYNVNNKVNRDEDVIGEDIVIDMNNWKKNKDFTNVILSPKPRMEGIHPYPYITFDNEVYYLDEEAYDLNPASAVYHKLEDYTMHDTRAIYNMNKSNSQLADEYNGVQPQQAPQEQNIDEDTHPGIAHNTSDDNPAIDNSGDGFDFDVPDFDDFSGIDDVEAPSPYNDQDTLQDPMCTNKK